MATHLVAYGSYHFLVGWAGGQKPCMFGRTLRTLQGWAGFPLGSLGARLYLQACSGPSFLARSCTSPEPLRFLVTWPLPLEATTESTSQYPACLLREWYPVLVRPRWVQPVHQQDTGLGAASESHPAQQVDELVFLTSSQVVYTN